VHCREVDLFVLQFELGACNGCFELRGCTVAQCLVDLLALLWLVFAI
jgi:hypothetical protein